MADSDNNKTSHIETASRSNDHQVKDAAWINEMRDHKARTGLYRSQDVERILGRPTDHAAIGVSTTYKIGSKLLAG